MATASACRLTLVANHAFSGYDILPADPHRTPGLGMHIMTETRGTQACDAEATDRLGKDKLREFTQQLMLIRRFEERAAREYAAGKISGFCHLYIGQEAVAVGGMGALEAKDHVITAYRDHGHALLRGCTPRSVMAELMGRVTGCAKGRGGSMHMFAAEQNFHGGHGIVGAHVPLATGFGFASVYKDAGEVSLCYLGEGAMNQGAFYESLNLASLWKLPCIYVIENNQYGMGTSLDRASAISELHTKAAAFGMTGVSVDGMDVAKMWEVVGDAAARARDERKPTLIEARCYRYRGHSMSDPQKYRSKEEVDERKLQDPILRAQKTLEDRGWATAAEFKAWDREAKDVAADSSEFARESPEPRLEDLAEYVYKDPMGWTPTNHTTPHVRTADNAEVH